MLKTIKHYQRTKINTSQPNVGKSILSPGAQLSDKDKMKLQGGSDTSDGPSFWEQHGDTITGVGKGVGKALNGLNSLNTSGNQTALGFRNSLEDAAINSGNPYAMAIGLATKAVDAIGDATGMHLDDMDKEAAEKVGVPGGAAFLNNAMQALPGFTPILGLMGQDTKAAQRVDELGESVTSGYSASNDYINNAQKLANKKFLFGVDEANAAIDEANRKTQLINEIGRVNTLAKLSTYDRDLAQQNLNRYAGTTYQMHAVGRNGMKILSRQELQAILATRKLQKGGVIGIDTNFIPEGSLHARLNHLQDVNPDLEDTTKKGIPVLDEGGQQVAEVEYGELTLTKSLTEKIEQLAKDGSNEAMIECGKLLVDEILLNTQDNTGQILNTEEDVKGSR